LLCVVCFFGASAPAQKHVPPFDEALSLKRVAAPRISPDGRYVVYSLTETNWKDNEYITRLWLADTKTGRSFQLTRGGESTGNAQWSPDGRWIAFATERAAEPVIEPEKPDARSDAKPSDAAKKDDAKADTKSDGKPAARQIWVISPEGGEAWQLTKSEGEIQAWAWSKDSTRIAFVANPPKAKPAKDRKDKYADFEVYEKEYDQNQLFLVDVGEALAHNAPARAVQLTRDPDLNVNDFSWSPDSTRIVFSARKVPLLAFTDDSDIYLLDLAAGNTVSKIDELIGPDESPVFSPDGKQVAFETALSGKNYYYLNHHIAVVDVEKALAHPPDDIEQATDLTAAFDENANILDWGPDGIYFYALQKTASHVYRLDPRTRAITRLTQNDAAAHDSASFSRDFRTMAFTMSDAQNMLEIYVSPVASFAPKRLTAMSDQIANWTLGTNEVVSWKSGDGTVIEGILHKPADYDASRKYPLLLVIHGGPAGVSRPTLQPADRTYPIQAFL